MTEPIFNGINQRILHLCVLREKTPTTNFLTPPSTWPLLFTHSTGKYKITTHRNIKPDICNISNYSQLGEYIVWEIDDIEDRTVDFAKHDIYSTQFWISTINSIIELIRKYKIVYFVNFPFDYFGIFEKLNNEFSKKLRSSSSQ